MVRVYGLQQGKSTDFSQVSVSLRTPGKCLLFLGANIYKLTFILNPPSSSSSRHRRCQAMATNKDNDRRARRERGRDYERRRDDDKKKIRSRSRDRRDPCPRETCRRSLSKPVLTPAPSEAAAATAAPPEPHTAANPLPPPLGSGKTDKSMDLDHDDATESMEEEQGDDDPGQQPAQPDPRTLPAGNESATPPPKGDGGPATAADKTHAATALVKADGGPRATADQNDKHKRRQMWPRRRRGTSRFVPAPEIAVQLGLAPVKGQAALLASLSPRWQKLEEAPVAEGGYTGPPDNDEDEIQRQSSPPPTDDHDLGRRDHDKKVPDPGSGAGASGKWSDIILQLWQATLRELR